MRCQNKRIRQNRIQFYDSIELKYKMPVVQNQKKNAHASDKSRYSNEKKSSVRADMVSRAIYHTHRFVCLVF